jgi:hypothetical protein
VLVSTLSIILIGGVSPKHLASCTGGRSRPYARDHRGFPCGSRAGVAGTVSGHRRWSADRGETSGLVLLRCARISARARVAIPYRTAGHGASERSSNSRPVRLAENHYRLNDEVRQSRGGAIWVPTVRSSAPLLQCALEMRMSCDVGDLNSRFGYEEQGQQVYAVKAGREKSRGRCKLQIQYDRR